MLSANNLNLEYINSILHTWLLVEYKSPVMQGALRNEPPDSTVFLDEAHVTPALFHLAFGQFVLPARKRVTATLKFYI